MFSTKIVYLRHFVRSGSVIKKFFSYTNQGSNVGFLKTNRNLVILTATNRFFSNEDRKCWNCKTLTSDTLICSKCKVLQKPDHTGNFFDLLNLDNCFDVDLKELSQKYKKLQRVLHPDLYASKTEEEKGIAEEYSALVNKAYNTLKIPLPRALYMLKLNNILIDESTAHDDPKFLMEIMERNEELEDITSVEEMRNFQNKISKVLSKLSVILSKDFKSNQLNEAKGNVIKLKYYNSIFGKIRDKKQKLGFPD